MEPTRIEYASAALASPSKSKRARPQSGLFACLILASLAAGLSAPGCVAPQESTNEQEEYEDIATDASPLTAGENMAVGKFASQSSTYNNDGIASHGVDGNTNGAWNGWSVTHTQAELSPWWQVDLGGAMPVGTIELYNRTDCCSSRLSNFKVLVSNDGVDWQAWDYPGTAGNMVSFTVDRAARYVKVQLNATGVADRILSLAEVKVLAASNLAVGKTATQSSNYYWGGGAPAVAVDGSSATYWSSGSVSHTDAELSPWWQVDLGSVQAIGTIDLLNRTDCCSQRLNNFKVLVSKDGTNWRSWDYPGTVGLAASFPINRLGRYVKVQLNSTGVADRILSLAEVWVRPPSPGVTPTCPAGDLVLDGTTCVTPTAWPAKTDLPANSQIAIRLRRAMVNYYGGSTEWVKWLGVSPSNSGRLDAVDASLTSRNLFTTTTFRPPGEQYYDLPWYTLLASTGKYVRPSGGDLLADVNDMQSATMFARGSASWNPDSLLFIPYTWAERNTRLAQIKSQGGHYSICQSAFTLGMPNVVGWYSGGAPNYGCYISGDVDYFVID